MDAQVFHLDTKQSSYIFWVTATGHLEQLHYGKKLRPMKDYSVLAPKRVIARGNTVAYSDANKCFTLDDALLEYSSTGKGDFREVACEVWSATSGSVTDFRYKKHTWSEGRMPIEGLPAARGNATNCRTLTIELGDEYLGLRLLLYYHIFYETDTITRHVTLVNEGTEKVAIRRLMSMQCDLPYRNDEWMQFSGSWVREMQVVVKALTPGVYINDSKTGTSSNRHNPLTLIKAPTCNETQGACYGFNLLYSGNHAEIIDVSPYETIRVLAGINPYLFDYQLEPKQAFHTPEAVMTYSNQGLNALSQQFHAFVNNHIIPPQHAYKDRPILINNWEATYFDFTEKKLLGLAKTAQEMGIELFVLDDGWFGERDDDTTSLGDWCIHEKKLPHGMKGLCEAINALGMQFGIWVEPEMVSPKSKLYAAHPEWAIQVPGRTPSEGRNQLVLDLTRQPVRTYIIDALTALLESCPISYVKWDMNRQLTDVYSSNLAGHQQGEVYHRYILGLYEVLEVLTSKFPHVLFEGCASGGNRFDLGMLYYMPQIWASDNSDASVRIKIQTGLSYGYPQSTMGAHVSSAPHHQTLRQTPLATRFHVAAFGVLGYELALDKLPQLEKKAIKEQVAFYKEHRKLFQYGDLYRIPLQSKEKARLSVVSKDKRKAILLDYQQLQEANGNVERLYTLGLDDTQYYEVATMPQKMNIKLFGDLINHALPIHIKKDGLLHHVVSGVYALDAEQTCYCAYGDTLNQVGICLNEQFNGTDYHSGVRAMGDFSSRLYTLTARDVT